MGMFMKRFLPVLLAISLILNGVLFYMQHIKYSKEQIKKIVIAAGEAGYYSRDIYMPYDTFDAYLDRLLSTLDKEKE